MKIAVVGLGKIGLPLAAQYASKGHTVIGVDVNETTIQTINQGIEPFPGEAHLAEYLTRYTASGDLKATANYAEAIPGADAVVVVVPLIVDVHGDPNFDWMDSATKDIAANLTAGTLVLYETTLPVGTTRTRWKPMLEDGSGLVDGTDFHVVFSPERVLTGRVFADLRKYPKLIGGLSETGAARAHDFYEKVLDFDNRDDLPYANGVWDLGSAEAAELTKLAETTYRDVNIALANQFALFADRAGVDCRRVIEAANSQPFSHIHQPGIAVGGHCIPVYPKLYLHHDPGASVVSAARIQNEAMPATVVRMLAQELDGTLDGMRVAILGAAYRGGVKETAFSGVFSTVRALLDAGAVPVVHDPLFSADELTNLGFIPFRLGEPADAAIIHTDHRAYLDLGRDAIPGVRVLVNGRPSFPIRRELWPRVATLGSGGA